MTFEISCCCAVESTWIFVYENKIVWGICDKHFESIDHRYHVKYVIDIKTGKLLSPSEIFIEVVT